MELLPEDILKVGISFLVGLLIGFEREYRSKSAGLRTMIMICMGSTMFTIFSFKIDSDTGRIAANIITGIGFIGAGIIFRENDRVVGITTAAIVWLTAAIGMGIGSGYYVLTFLCFLIASAALILLYPLQHWINSRSQIRHYRLNCIYKRKTLNNYEVLFKKNGLKILESKQRKEEKNISGHWILQGTQQNHERLTSKLLMDPEILEMEF
ncbi:putative Mg2+ transporter-C (MgtC) family protein [Dyadobacter jejuensis]|uniref:Putative Mg2+ transporter-C (MgtC) family protein n=1 Tax=Dyadobacter jejuensis TaxID=1082580 RepID=A0A316AT13_9BACT|nr:MgtC/SapB family protein [Dyadobacter jejuensis]PWJ60658.1 putative Mg2+ transporter-C (MgtC) family protein [Dyadobacter jejuensis]